MFPRDTRNDNYEPLKSFDPNMLQSNYLEVPQASKYHNYSSDQSSHVTDSDFQDSSYHLGTNSEAPSDFWSHGTDMVTELEFPIENPFPSATTRNLIRNMSIDFPLVKTDSSDQLCRMPFGSQESVDNPPIRMNSNEGLKPFAKEFLIKQPTFEEEKSYETLNGSKSNLKAEHQEEQALTGKRGPEETRGKPKIVIKRAPSLEETVSRRKTGKGRPKKADSEKTKRSTRTPSDSKRSRRYKQDSKNIVKNYGKAMSAFALTDMAKPYRDKLLVTHQLPYDTFKEFIINHKEKIDSIGSLREMMLPLQADPQELQSIKKIFRALSEIFVRDFAVNWIFSSKSNHKETLLKYRFKILRRVQQPTQFTYLKNY